MEDKHLMLLGELTSSIKNLEKTQDLNKQEILNLISDYKHSLDNSIKSSEQKMEVKIADLNVKMRDLEKRMLVAEKFDIKIGAGILIFTFLLNYSIRFLPQILGG